MDIHKNARLTLRSREALVQYAASGECLRSVAASFHVTPKTAAKWLRRYRAEGTSGLYDRSSRPRHSPRATPSSLLVRVLELRREHRPGYHIAHSTGLSPATVSRILRRAHLNRWRDLHPAPPVVRYEHPFPGDLLHLDIKGMTRYQRVSIRGDGRRRGRPQHAGWEALHIAIDDHSKKNRGKKLETDGTFTNFHLAGIHISKIARCGPPKGLTYEIQMRATRPAG